MHQRDPNYVGLNTWQSLTNSAICQLNDSTYICRLSHPVIEPRQTIGYKDNNLTLYAYRTDPKSVLGYAVTLHTKFNVVQSSWYISFINKNVTAHTNPNIVYQDGNMYFRKFNEINHSYWLTLKKKK